MAGEKAGRPRVLVRRHVFEIKEDTRDWIEETAQKFVLEHEVAQVAKGFVSTNAGAIMAAGGILVTLMSFKPTRDAAFAFIAFMQQQLTNVLFRVGGGVVSESTQSIIDELNRQLQELKDALANLPPPGNGTGPPPTSSGDCPPGYHLELAPTPAGLIPQCVRDDPVD